MTLLFLEDVSLKVANVVDTVWARFNKHPIHTNSDLVYAMFLAVIVTWILGLFLISNIKPSTDTKTSKPIPPWRPTSLFALLIGIDKYADPDDNLDGAVADAEDVKRYLENSLGADVCHIQTLYNEAATREAILDHLTSLIDEKLIHKGDPIVIFYAGHGSHSKAPAGWKTENGMIQLLVPHDFDERVDNGVAMISDREISVLLERIAAAKGNNITVIFDCCHSGSITRWGNRRARFISTRKPISKLVDPNILETDSQPGSTTRSGFLTKGLRSHVLLAACRATQLAWENENRGHFTKALVEALEGASTQAVSYHELIQRIDLVNQNPQCEGYHQHRIWLDPEARIQRPSSYSVLGGDGSYTMHAGAADGIMEGERFDVYKDEKWVAEVTTSNIQAYFTTVNIISGKAWSGEGLAVKIRAGNKADLSLHIVTEQKSIWRPFAKGNKRLDCVHEALRKASGTRSLQRIVVVDEREKAELSISVKDKQIIVNIVDPLVTVHGLHQMFEPIRSSAEHASQVLQAAAHYYRYFRRLDNKDTTGLLKEIEIEFKLLVGDSAKKYGKQHLNPTGENLITGGIVNLYDERVKYGITITNGSKTPLYASVFFFETSTFAIDSIYEPPTAAGRKVDPLDPNETLTIGYGSSGAPPIEFELKDGQEFDVGFFKFFVSDAYVDLSAVKQSSSFDQKDQQDTEPEPGKPRRFKRKANANTSGGVWFTHLVPVVLRSRPSAVID